MELRQLKYFAEVAETLNFSDAARNLYITQSTLSQQVKQLEQELDMLLLQRNSHSVSLTEAGEQLLPYALQTLHCASLCLDRVHDLQQMLSGTLNIGVTFSFSPILTETLAVFMKRYPHVRLNIYYKTMEELMEMLSARKIDFVLAFRPVASYADIESHILFDNHLSAIVSVSHPLAKRDKITLDDLAKYDIALPTKGLQARNAFDRMKEKYHVQLHVRIELNEVNIMLKLVKQSMLVGILSEATTYDTDGIKAIPIDCPENEMQGCVHTLRNTYRKHSMLEFIKMLSEANAVKERIRDWVR
ncbi:MAG: LysR family transcriptional regulator [Prevotella sp.]